ncbi:hypothetical protein BV20DRAFT_1055405 [Pilatotrama ljubarskyi]|nr:hypothetical protein BV20DRAFT_1055405 [Pilatotrama ljubarskyi]
MHGVYVRIGLSGRPCTQDATKSFDMIISALLIVTSSGFEEPPPPEYLCRLRGEQWQDLFSDREVSSRADEPRRGLVEHLACSDGVVHNPRGAASYLYEKGWIKSLLGDLNLMPVSARLGLEDGDAKEDTI